MTKKTNRRGATAVEVAFVAPVLFALLFASIDIARVQNIRNTAALAAYEGARAGMLPGKSASEVLAIVQQNIAVVGINDASITITPSVIDDTTTEVTVGINAPLATNLYAFSTFFSGKHVTASCTLQREASLQQASP